MIESYYNNMPSIEENKRLWGKSDWKKQGEE
jgi:hypothetical protein